MWGIVFFVVFGVGVVSFVFFSCCFIFAGGGGWLGFLCWWFVAGFLLFLVFKL